MTLHRTIFAFDTTGSQDSFALFHENSYFEKELPLTNSQGQSARLLIEMRDFLKEHHLTFKDIQYLCTLTGPGSFTGIRLGLATALGLKIAHAPHCFAVNKFQLLAFIAQQAHPNHPVTVQLPGQTGEWFLQTFDTQGHPLSSVLKQSHPLPPTTATPHVIISDTPHPGVTMIPEQPLATALAHYAHISQQSSVPWPDTPLIPFYVHDPIFKKLTRYQDAPHTPPHTT